MLVVSGLYIYPVKSLGGIPVNSAEVTSRGLQHDRRMMLTDSNNCFLTQREYAQMALLQTSLASNGIIVEHKKKPIDPLFVPWQPTTRETTAVTVWDDVCDAVLYDASINDWFSKVLDISCRLVFMDDSSIRYVDRRYASNNEITSFADDYPMLLIGDASLEDLNTRLETPIPMNRFRPNIVFSGGAPFQEDRLQQFSINGIGFSGVKPCARCIITTTDQENAVRSKEPLKTLATYRTRNNKILFGQNLVHSGTGTISVGDTINVSSYQPGPI